MAFSDYKDFDANGKMKTASIINAIAIARDAIQPGRPRTIL